MTDKQIMIDGVNVGKCRYFLKDTEGQDYDTDEFVKGCCEAKGSCIGYEFAGYGLCRGDKDCYFKQLARKTRECEELKKQLMQKSEVDMFFNTPIEGWSNDPCGICPHKAENEELKKEIINKNEKIKELRFSVSDLTNRLCYLNAEKSFRIVDLEQALDEVKAICDKTCQICQFFGKCDKEYNSCKNAKMLNIINKAKGEGND